MDRTIRGRLQALLEKESPAKRQESKLRKKVEQMLRNEKKTRDQRTPADRGRNRAARTDHANPSGLNLVSTPEPEDSEGEIG